MSALLEREDEVAHLTALIERARRGRGGVLAVEGPAGIGKTRLGREAAARAMAEGMAVVDACGSELEREFGFGAVRQLFEAPLLDAGDARRRDLLDGAAALAAPALGQPGDEPPGDALDARFPVVHGLYWLTANLAAERPLLLWVDDLQWADEPSQRFLAYLGRRLDDLAAALVVGLRPPLPGEDRSLIDGLVGQRETVVVHPAPLSTEAVAALAAERLGLEVDPAFAEICRRMTAGNALLVEEILTELAETATRPDADAAAALAEAGLERVSRGVGRRLDRLPAGAAELAEAVAVLGDGCALDAAAALAGLHVEHAQGAAEALAAADILAPEPRLRFRHPVVRAAAAQRLPGLAGAAAHGRAARIVAERDAPPAVVAAHLLAASPIGDSWAVDALRRAAREAVRQGAPELAARQLQRALDEPPPVPDRAAVLLELGTAEQAAGVPSGPDRMRDALALIADRAERGRVALRLSAALAQRQRWGEAAAVARPALAELGDSDRDLGLMLEATLADCVRMDLSVGGDEPERIRSLAAGLAGNTPGERWVLATAAAMSSSDTAADHTASAELFDRSLADGAHAVGRPETGIVSNLIRAGRLDQAERAIGRFMDDAQRGGHVHRHALMLSMRGWVGLERGALGGAEEDLRAALDLSRDVGLPSGSLAAMLALVLAERGETGEADELLREHQMAGGLPEQQVMNPSLHFRARVRLAQGRTDDALADAREVGARYERWGIRRAVPPWRSLAAVLLARRGHQARARALAEEELELADRWDTAQARAVALRGLGLVTGDAELLAAAAQALAGSPARLELARTEVELGALLRRAGRRADSREPLRRGMDLAHACGARPLAERARTELLATGARPRRLALTGAEALTPSERRVSELAASRLTNRQIAQSLFVTASTVETHLRHAFRKLDVSSREELPAALAEASG